MANERVLLSTDIGSDVDDAIALLAILNAGIDLRAVHTVNGDVSARAFIAKKMVDLAGKKTKNPNCSKLQGILGSLLSKMGIEYMLQAVGYKPNFSGIKVCVGESLSLDNLIEPYSYLEYAYVEEEYIDESKINRGDYPFKPFEEFGILGNSVEELAKALAKDRYVVFSIAPMTNIARLIQNHPNAAKNIEHLYVMGCRFDEQQHEHNVRHDVLAAQLVFDSSIPITVVPSEICSQYRMPVDYKEQLISPIGLYTRRMIEGFVAAKTANNVLSERLADLIKRMVDGSAGGLTSEEYLHHAGRKERLLTEIDDPEYAAFLPDKYFRQYHDLIAHLRESPLCCVKGNAFATILKMSIPKDLSVADVFIPYCFLNKDRIKTERANIVIGANGYSSKTAGDKHTIVTGIDYNDFDRFLRENLR